MLEVGAVVKPHGVKGEVIVELVSNRPARRLVPGSVLHTHDARLQVASARPHGGRWIVAFTGIDGRDGAERLRGAVLTAPPLDEPGTLWVHELIGAPVVDTTGRAHGPVVAVEANPAADLLVLEDGRLVPLTFVVGAMDTAASGGDRPLVIDPPPGLLDG